MVVSLPDSKYKSAQQKVSFLDQALRQLEAIPGVHAAAVATNVPFGVFDRDDIISIQGRAFRLGDYRQASAQSVNSGYFRAMNIPLRQGRFVAETDGADQPLVVGGESELC